MLRAAARFLAAHAEAELRLLLVSDEAELLAAVEQKCDAARVARDVDARFTTLHGSLATLRTVGGHGARFVANDANHRLSPRGSSITRLLHSVSPLLEDATARARRGCVVEPGGVFSVRLPAEDVLRLAQGVEFVIHAVGPNMNPHPPRTCCSKLWWAHRPDFGRTNIT